MKLAIVTTHPIQNHAPWFRHIAAQMDIEVLYAYRQDANGQAAAGFSVPFEWDTPLLDGYPSRWLKNVARHPTLENFRGCDTPELADVLPSERFDACLIFGWNRKCFIQATIACMKERIPVLMRGDSHLLTPRSRLHRIGKYLPYRVLLPRCDAHLYVGRRNWDYLRHYGVPKSKLFFSPHCVDNHFFTSEASTARTQGRDRELRKQLGIRNDEFVALFVGKLISVKRPGDFVRACVLLNATLGSEMHGVIVGSGPLIEELKELAHPAAERIHFAGFRNQREIPTWYTVADMLVLPSATETWGLVANEAMSCGLPVIASADTGCAVDLIEPGKTGYTYATGNIDGLVSQIKRLRSQLESDGRTICEALFNKMRQYSPEQATSGLSEALARIIRPRKVYGC